MALGIADKFVGEMLYKYHGKEKGVEGQNIELLSDT